MWTERYDQSSSGWNASGAGAALYAAERPFASLSSALVPSDWASLPALTRWKSGVGTKRSAAPGSARASATIRWVSGPNGSRCWGFVVRVLRSVSWRVHSWSERTAFQGSLDDLLAELDRLGEDDLLLGGQQRDLADLLEVHPDRVVDPDHVRGELASSSSRGGLVDLGRPTASPGASRSGGHLDALDRLLGDDLDRQLGGVRARRPRAQVEKSSLERRPGRPEVDRCRARPRAQRPCAGAALASFASSSSRLVRAGAREHGLDELLVRGSVMSRDPPGWLERRWDVGGGWRSAGL